MLHACHKGIALKKKVQCSSATGFCYILFVTNSRKNCAGEGANIEQPGFRHAVLCGHAVQGLQHVQLHLDTLL